MSTDTPPPTFGPIETWDDGSDPDIIGTQVGKTMGLYMEEIRTGKVPADETCTKVYDEAHASLSSSLVASGGRVNPSIIVAMIASGRANALWSARRIIALEDELKAIKTTLNIP